MSSKNEVLCFRLTNSQPLPRHTATLSQQLPRRARLLLIAISLSSFLIFSALPRAQDLTGRRYSSVLAECRFWEKISRRDMEKSCTEASNVKGGRNYLLWQPSWIREMLKMMADMSTDYSYKANGQWENNAYAFVAKQLDSMFGKPGITAVHVNRQVRSQRRKWDIIQKVKSLSGASWVEDEKKIVMGKLEAMLFSRENKEAGKYLNVPILDYNFLEVVCGGHATGQWARDSNDNFSSLDNVIELEGDEASGEPIDDANYNATSEDEKKRMGGTSSNNNTKVKQSKRACDDIYRNSRIESLSQIAESVEKMSHAMETISQVLDTAGYRDNLLSNVYDELNRLGGLTEDEIEHCFDHFVTSDIAIASSFMIRPNNAKANFVRNFLRKNPISQAPCF